MSKAKLVGALILVIIAVIVVLQNMENVETRLLLVTVTMPRAALLFVTLLIGIAAGILAAIATLGRKP